MILRVVALMKLQTAVLWEFKERKKYMYLLGIDLGTSSIKAAVIEAESGKAVAQTFYPKSEMGIDAPRTGWAEQHPDTWWKYTQHAIKSLTSHPDVRADQIRGIGISYQMHGLVLVDKDQAVIRPSIIWCDSRAVSIGQDAFENIGRDKCLQHMLNSPGNFTASKLKWVRDNEPESYEKIHKIMLPGDFLGMKLTGEILTTYSGLSEGIMWDFQENQAAGFLFDYFQLDQQLLPQAVSSCTHQGTLKSEIASSLGLAAGIPVAYRSGDQPNNAFSLGAIHPGEIAATAGTSGVVYGVCEEIVYDPLSRVNTFAHVNHDPAKPSLGVLLCVNGTGILNSWLRRNLTDVSYDEMNQLAGQIPPGAEGLVILPFGNGAERVLENRDIGAKVSNINFNIHTDAHLIRAAHEGIAYSFRYGIDIMKDMGLEIDVIRAAHGNMFLSPIFRETLATISGANIELIDTNGAQGAARGAGIGMGLYKSFDEALGATSKIETIEPDSSSAELYEDAYQRWLQTLNNALKD